MHLDRGKHRPPRCLVSRTRPHRRRRSICFPLHDGDGVNGRKRICFLQGRHTRVRYRSITSPPATEFPRGAVRLPAAGPADDVFTTGPTTTGTGSLRPARWSQIDGGRAGTESCGERTVRGLCAIVSSLGFLFPVRLALCRERELGRWRRRSSHR